MIEGGLYPELILYSFDSQTFLGSVLATRIYYAHDFKHSCHEPEGLAGLARLQSCTFRTTMLLPRGCRPAECVSRNLN